MMGKYDEDKIVSEIMDYINETYRQHYSESEGEYQTMDSLIANKRALPFCLASIDKYSQRFGKKGTPEDSEKDLFKIIHYAMIAIYINRRDS